MTTDPVLVFGVVAGSFLSFAYVVVARFPVNALNKTLVFFLGSAGVAAGIKVCSLSLNPNMLQELNNERLYVFLGGLAVSWVSAESITSVFQEVKNKPAKSNQVSTPKSSVEK
ncbi:MAG: hypothetical protein AB4050_19440 [Synechococcus sp.]